MAVLVLSMILPPGSRHIRWVVSAGLAQVSEFSFVLSSRARRAGIISREVSDKLSCEVVDFSCADALIQTCKYGEILTPFLHASLGSGVPAGPQCHHSQSAAGTSAVEDQHAQMGSRGPTQNHHMTGPSEKFLGPNLWVKGTIALC